VDVPFFFLPPASAALALVLRVTFSLGMVIGLMKLRVSKRVNETNGAAIETNWLVRWSLSVVAVETWKCALLMAMSQSRIANATV